MVEEDIRVSGEPGSSDGLDPLLLFVLNVNVVELLDHMVGLHVVVFDHPPDLIGIENLNL